MESTDERSGRSPDAQLTVLLICGIGSDEDSWRDQLRALAADRPCHASVAEGDTIDAMAADVLARAPARFAIAGHSLGGYVALAVQRIAPERVSHLALVNTSALPDTDDQSAKRRKLIAVCEAKSYAFVAQALARTVGASDTELVDRYLAMLLRAGQQRFVRDQTAAMTRPDARPALASIACPTLVIGSSGDPVVAPEASRDIAAGVAGARLLMIESDSHAAPMAAPTLVTAALQEWLAQPHAVRT